MPSHPPHAPHEFEVVRDPLWNTIRLDRTAVALIDTPEFQRLRHIRQLGLAYLVYPGATHTRFDHALGVYHLARWALGLLAERGELEGVDAAECALVPYAALLHDVGHYPFSHALEELDGEWISGHHETHTGRFLAAPRIAATLETVAPGAAGRIEALVRGASDSPLQGLVSGSLDLDKIEYLRRDALFCGVPYGEVDVDRLLHALVLVDDPATGRREIGIHEKGLSALESMLFAKYQMFRNVYWHHAVRAATSLYKRLVQEAVDGGLLTQDDIVGQTDERLLVTLEVRAESASGALADRVARCWLPCLRERRLPKRALELPGEALRGLPAEDWLYTEPRLRYELELRLARDLGMDDGGAFVDYPEKPRMLGLDMLMMRRDGSVHRLTDEGRAGLIDLPQLSDELYYTARAFRIFTLDRRMVDPRKMLGLLSLSADEMRARLADAALLV
jgi:HD superfamily phosphohydrolase